MDFPARRPVFLHYLNREILSAYGISEFRQNEAALPNVLKITRYALLLSDTPMLIVPKYVFETPFFEGFVRNITPVLNANLIQYVSPHPDYSDDISVKQQQYRNQKSNYDGYFNKNDIRRANVFLRSLAWSHQKSSISTSDRIKNVWNDCYESNGLEIKMPNFILANTKIENIIRNIPTSIEDAAFIPSNVIRLLGNKQNGLVKTELNFFINSTYLHHYIDLLDSIIIVDTPLGRLDFDLSAEKSLSNRLVSYYRLQNYFNALGIRKLIENSLSWQDLIGLRSDLVFRWLIEKGLQYSLVHSPNHFEIEMMLLKMPQNYQLGASKNISELKLHLLRLRDFVYEYESRSSRMDGAVNTSSFIGSGGPLLNDRVDVNDVAMNSEKKTKEQDHSEVSVSKNKRNEIVVLVHGIRTHANWYRKLRTKLMTAGYRVVLTNYGRFDLIRFLLPFNYFRKKAKKKLYRQIRDAIKQHPNSIISVIAHSFGTYLIAEALNDEFDLRLNKIIFIGSVVKYDYPFENISERFNGEILNEVGSRDLWPVLAESMTTGYGSAGTYGFKRPRIFDRWNNTGHSDILTKNSSHERWIEYLKTGKVSEGEALSNVPAWIQIFSIFKVKYIFFLVLCVFAFNGFL